MKQGKWIKQTLQENIGGYSDFNSYCIRDARTNVHIATVGGVDRFFGTATENHAQLIAAAPEMLRALKDVRAAYQTMFDVMPVAFQTFADIVESAIKSAEPQEESGQAVLGLVFTLAICAAGLLLVYMSTGKLPF